MYQAMNSLITKDASQVVKNRLEFGFEVKHFGDSEDPDFFFFEGLASTFGNIDLVDDIVEKGAFLKSIAEKMPVILWQHRSSEPIGMPMEIRETDQGLFIRVKLPKADTLVSGRVIPQMKIGSIRKMSIGFNIVDSEMDGRLRRLKEIDLLEVSLVTFPANPQAGVSGFKNQDGEPVSKFNLEDVINLKSKKDLREFFKSSGVFTKQAREYILTTVFKSQSESGDEDTRSESEKKEAASVVDAWRL